MTSRKVKQELQHFSNTDIILSLYWRNFAYPLSSPILRIRRASDNAETYVYINQLLGFIDDDSLTSEIITTTIADWIGASTAYITTWYNQIGNEKHIYQGTSSLQPQLVLSGSGFIAKPMFNVSVMNSELFTSYYSPSSIFVVYQADLGQIFNDCLLDFTGGTFESDEFAIRYRTDNIMYCHYKQSNNIFNQAYVEPDTTANNDLNLVSLILTGVNGGDVYFNGSYLRNINNGNGFKGKVDQRYTVGMFDSTLSTKFNGYIAEIIVAKKEFNESDREHTEQVLTTNYGIS